MRLSTSYKVMLLSFASMIIIGCSHTYDENNNFIADETLHKMNEKIVPIDASSFNLSNVSIQVVDSRPFQDTVSNEDLSNYFIDHNQDDTKEVREKTVGYIGTTFTSPSNVVMPYKITEVIANYVKSAVVNNRVENKDVKVVIDELWESFFGESTMLRFSLVLTDVVPSGTQKVIDSAGYRYIINIEMMDKNTEISRSHICKNSVYNGIWSLNEEEISVIYTNMMNDIKNCINENVVQY